MKVRAASAGPRTAARGGIHLLPVLADANEGKRRFPWLSLQLSLGIVVLFFVGLMAVGVLPWKEGLAIGSVFLVSAAVIFGLSELRSNPVHPLSLLIVFVALNYGIRGVAIEAFGLPVWGVVDPRSHLASACAMISLSIALYALGYGVPWGATLARRVPLLYFAASRRRIPGMVLRLMVLYALGWVARLYLFSLGIWHGNTPRVALNGLVSIATEGIALPQTAFVAVLLLALASEVPVWLLAILFGGEVFYGLLYGGASAPFLPLFYAAPIYWLCRKRARWPLLVGGMAALIVVVAPVATSWRNAYYRAVEEKGPSLTAVDESFDMLLRNPDILHPDQSMSERYGRLDMLLIVLERVPLLFPFQNGNTFLPYLLEAPLPRVLYPQKKIVEPTHLFAESFRDDYGGTSVSIGYVGEAYLNFGYFGLLLCPLVGFFIRFFWERLKVCSQVEPCWTMRLPLVLFQIALSWESGLAYWYISLLRGPLLLLPILIFVYGRLPSVSRQRRVARCGVTPAGERGRGFEFARGVSS